MLLSLLLVMLLCIGYVKINLLYYETHFLEHCHVSCFCLFCCHAKQAKEGNQAKVVSQQYEQTNTVLSLSQYSILLLFVGQVKTTNNVSHRKMQINLQTNYYP